MAQPFSQRLAKVREWMAEQGLSAFLVSDLSNIRYLTNFSGSNALLVIQKDRADFFTDFRYQEQSAQEVPSSLYHIHSDAPDVYEAAVTLLKETTGPIGFERFHLRYHFYLYLRSRLRGKSLRGVKDIIRTHRAVKDDQEVKKILQAQRIAEQVLQEVLSFIQPGRTTEMDLAAEIEYRMKRLGAQGPSFPTIVATGRHSALPHARPRNHPIEPNAPLLFDMGCVVDGYASDMTRTFWVGSHPDPQFLQIYDIVNEARQRAIEAIRPGVPAKEIDTIARQWIKDHGYGEYFGHGLGHGVGLEVHERPVVSYRSKETLETGHVITIEPGIYLPELGGVRIEDLVLVQQPATVLTNFSTELLRIE